MKKILIILVPLVAAVGLFIWLNKQLVPEVPIETTNDPIVIGFSLGTTHEERWFTDRDLFVKKAEELGATVKVALSDNNAEEQNSQLENMISQGIKVIVVVPYDYEKIVPVIEKARSKGVKIIAYDRLIKGTDIDFYISFDNVKVGELEAGSVLKIKDKGNFAYIGGSQTDNNAFLLKSGTMMMLNPKIINGDIKLVIDQFMADWKSDEAYKTVKKYLASGQTLDAVIAANDGTAFGSIQALKEKGLAGKIPVSGQDADLAACQRIIEGTQTATVYKPINLLAYQAARIAFMMAKGEKPETNNIINNGKIDVPSYFLNPIIVDKNNMMDTVIKDGFHTYEEVYKKTN
jgi:D-xylose transport system substrate-binding protein